MYRGWQIAVVVPAFNEARLLPVTLSGLPDFIDLVIVVDDASTDHTLVAARPFGGRVEVIRHARNLGVGGAIVTGYRRALALGVRATVVVGADAQMDPQEMHRLLDALIDGRADYAKGDRLGHPEVLRRMPLVRYLGSRVLSLLTRLATGYSPLRDPQCGYTAITRQALSALPLDGVYERYGFPNDLLAKLSQIGARVVDCPVSPIYGDEVSRLRVARVILPISRLLLRAVLARLLRSVRVSNEAQEPNVAR